MNSVIGNIKKRRSIKGYTAKPVSKKLIKEIIEAGRYAPSSHNSQPWRFIVITNQKKIKELSEYIKDWFRTRHKLGQLVGFINKKVKSELKSAGKRLVEKDLFFYGAPCLILICAKRSRFSKIDCACAAQNMMLAARSLDIGSCWVGFADMVINRDTVLMEELGVPKNHKIVGHLIFGYPIKFPETAFERKEKADVIKWL
ncbi:MAG: nitroreductase family protein [Nanoarchaeota archaeon]|nr:nitroreductase family protein [Nanoarchaeota archaeon]